MIYFIICFFACTVVTIRVCTLIPSSSGATPSILWWVKLQEEEGEGSSSSGYCYSANFEFKKSMKRYCLITATTTSTVVYCYYYYQESPSQSSNLCFQPFCLRLVKLRLDDVHIGGLDGLKNLPCFSNQRGYFIYLLTGKSVWTWTDLAV